MQLLVVPGLDGTGDLLKAFIAALPSDCPATVVRYPTTAPMGYEALEGVVRASLPAEGTVVLLGESFSGPIAVSLAVSLPSRVVGLILCCTFVRNPRQMLRRFIGLMQVLPLSRVPKGFAARALYGRWATGVLCSALGSAMRKVSPAVSRERLSALVDIDVTAKLLAVRVPVLVLVASKDRLVPRRSLALLRQCCPGAQIVTLEGPHGLLQAKPGKAAELVGEFVKSVASNRHPL